MHSATCGQCRKPCQVPFKPSGSRPVFCSQCFNKDEYSAGKERGASDSRRPSYGGDRPSYGDRSSERSEERPSYNRTVNGGSTDGQSLSRLSEQLKALDVKLDQILEALEEME